MDNDKQRQEISVIGRLFSLEALLAVMGFLSLVSGVMTGDPLRLGIGLSIICVIILLIVRRRSIRKN
jgi:hypothetical protein